MNEEPFLDSTNNDKKGKGNHTKIMSSLELSCKTENNNNNLIKAQREQTYQPDKKNSNNLLNSVRNTEKTVIIEDNIYPSRKSENINVNDNKKTKKKYIYHIIPINVLKVITIIMIFLYIISGFTNLFFFIKEREEEPFLFCFNFIQRYSEADMDTKNKDSDVILFLTDLNSFCIIHIILLFIFIYLLITLFRNKEKDNEDIKDFFKDVSIFLDLTILVNIVIFILGILANHNDEKYLKFMICYIVLTGLGTIFMFIIYIKTKSKQYKNATRLINQGLLSGVLTSFELYCFLYNICYLATWRTHTDYLYIEIIPGVIYFIIGFCSTIVYKDIIFSITMLIIEIGLLYFKKDEAFSVVIFNIFAVFFNFSSINLTIFNYNKKVFNLEEEIDSKKTK